MNLPKKEIIYVDKYELLNKINKMDVTKCRECNGLVKG